MTDRFAPMRWATKTVVATIAAIALMSGAAWHVLAAGSQSTAAHAATVTTPLTHTVAGGRDSYADVVHVVAPAVVTIHTEGKATAAPTQFQTPNDDFFRQFFGDRFGDQLRPDQGQMPPRAFRQNALGSGVIVSSDGYILTNYHVVDSADTIHVEMIDGRTVTAKIVGSDRPSDLALLKVSASDLHPIAIGNSDAVQVGDVVLAVGNPMGIGQTVTMGIISAKGRSTGAGEGGYEDFLQTDAPINHGNSGGALVNTKGQLVGINSQILSNSDGNIGIGFAIPSNMAENVMEQLRTKGRVTRAQLGVTVQAVTSDMASNLGLTQVGGAIVSAVAPGSAAERAGVKRGDVIESFNGEAVHDTNSLRNRVAAAGPGSTADLVVMRDGSEKHLSVKLDEANVDRTARRSGESNSPDNSALGLSVEPLTPDLASRLGATRDAQGLVVQNVDPEGRAAAAGIQSGDIIVEANRQPVHSVEELRAAARRSTDRPTLLLINRQGHDIFVTVSPANG